MIQTLPEKFIERSKNTKNIFLTGHYGSGKTEIAVNLILEMARQTRALQAAGNPEDAPQGAFEGKPRKLAIVDIDIVNPFFRSRERKEMLDAEGVRLIASSESAPNADMPALPGDIMAAFDEKDLFTIFDVGGDPVGARVLHRYIDPIKKNPYELFVVVNQNRPNTKTPELAASYVEAIEQKCGLKATGIIGNSHLSQFTTADTVREGIQYAEEVSKLTGLDVIFCTAEKKFADELDGENILPIDIYMKKPWEE